MVLLGFSETRLVEIDFGEDCNLGNGQISRTLVSFLRNRSHK